MNPNTNLPGPDFLDAVANAELANGNEINAAEYSRRAQEWRNDLALRDHCDGCYPGLVRDYALAQARITELETQLRNARSALAA